jgi:hypothetical protein
VRELLRAAGFAKVRVEVKPQSRDFNCDWIPGSGVEDFVASATIEAVKPVPKGSCEPSGCC